MYVILLFARLVIVIWVIPIAWFHLLVILKEEENKQTSQVKPQKTKDAEKTKRMIFQCFPVSFTNNLQYFRVIALNI